MNCGKDCETFPHIILEFRLAQIMWRMSPIGSVPSFNGNESLLVWFDKLIERWNGEENKQFIILAMLILRRIWKCQNERLFDGQSVEAQSAVLMAVKDAPEFTLALDSRNGTLGCGGDFLGSQGCSFGSSEVGSLCGS